MKRLGSDDPMRDPLFIGFVVVMVLALVVLFVAANGGRGVGA